jgi:hypothetical protein
MASSQSVQDEAARPNPIVPAVHRFGRAVFASQSRNWLTERSIDLPQVCLVFDEELPNSARGHGKFEYP